MQLGCFASHVRERVEGKGTLALFLFAQFTGVERGGVCGRWAALQSRCL
jgi:hypothetical protein